MANENTSELAKQPYPIVSKIAYEESFKSKPYQIKGEGAQTIGYGHYLDNPQNYVLLAQQLGIKDPLALTEEEGKKLLAYDISVRQKEMDLMYPETKPLLKNIMMNERFRWSPKGFDKMYGEELKNNDVEGLKNKLTQVGKIAQAKKLGGVAKRAFRINADLGVYQRGDIPWQE